MNTLKEFWEAHKHKVFSFGLGAAAVVGLMAANLLCNKLPPPFAQMCVSGSQMGAQALREESARQAETFCQTECSSAKHTPGAANVLQWPDGGQCVCP